jgi:opacity protein-like surface antigen
MKTTAARAALAALLSSPAAFARAETPTCAAWRAGDRAAEACSCGSETRTGDDRLAACASAPAPASAARPAPASPASRIAAASSAGSFDGGPRFGLLGAEASGGYITGADGRGLANASVGLTLYRQKTKVGVLSAQAEFGRYRMNGIPIYDSQSVGVVGQLPNGAPVTGTVITTGVSPAVAYVPLAAFRYAPAFRLGPVQPYAVGEAGLSRLSSTNALVDSTLVASAGGQVVFTQNLGTSLQPTGESRNHPGGGFGGGVTVGLTRRVSLDAQYLDAPTGYKIFKTGVVVNLARRKPVAAAASR